MLSLVLVLAAHFSADAYDTEWIAPGKAASAAKLKEALDEAQERLAKLEEDAEAAADRMDAFETNPWIPAGTIVAYGGQTAPQGWLLCDGAPISRTEYADIFAVIKLSFGEGDGIETFNVPDLQGYFLRGLGREGGIDPGRVVGSFQSDELESHNHIVQAFSGAVSGGPTTFTLNNWNGGTLVDTRHPVSSTGGSETRPMNVAVNYIIKY
jgi:microcystin-dependent protein